MPFRLLFIKVSLPTVRGLIDLNVPPPGSNGDAFVVAEPVLLRAGKLRTKCAGCGHRGGAEGAGSALGTVRVRGGVAELEQQEQVGCGGGRSVPAPKGLCREPGVRLIFFRLSCLSLSLSAELEWNPWPHTC